MNYMLSPEGDGWQTHKPDTVAPSPFPYSNVAVTGGAGFLGSYVVERLRTRGVENVFVPRSRDYDLRDMGAVRRFYEDAQPDCVIHLAAACGGIGANRANAGGYYYDNLIMGAQVMEEARKRDVKKFVAVGSVCAYPKNLDVPFLESDLWNGYPEETNAPYGLAKKMLLVQAQAYRQQYGFNAIYLLPANIYGPRDNFDPETSHVIPALIRKCVEAAQTGAEYVAAWGTGAATRDFLHADDAARGIVIATEKYNHPEPVNLGAGYEMSIRELAKEIAALTNFKGRILWDVAQPDGQPRRKLDTSRAQIAFGFRAAIGLVEGLRQTVDWYLETSAKRRTATGV